LRICILIVTFVLSTKNGIEYINNYCIMKINTLINKIENYIAFNQTEQALIELRNSFNDTEFENYVILYSAKLNELKKSTASLSISDKDAALTKAQINSAILELLSEIKKSPTQISIKTKVFISYNRKSPDEGIAHNLFDALTKAGYEPFLDVKSIRIGERWETSIINALNSADYFVALLSKESLMSDMVTEEIKRAKELSEREFNPLVILPIRVCIPMEVSINTDIEGYLSKIQHLFWNTENDTENVFAHILDVIANEKPQAIISAPQKLKMERHTDAPLPVAPLVYPGGTVSMNSSYYIERGKEDDILNSVLENSALVRIKGPRQYGKSSLMARIISHAAKNNHKIIPISLQLLQKKVLSDIDLLLQEICFIATEELNVEDQIDKYWSRRGDAQRKCQNYFEQYLLKESNSPILLAIDEADRIFDFDEISNQFFGMLRGWNERSKIVPIWANLKMTIAYSTEAYLAITDLNQSPFNIGLEIQLREFNAEEVLLFSQKHGLKLNESDIKKIMQMFGGQPFLLHKALYEIAKGTHTLTSLLEAAPTDDGLFGDHLRRHLYNISQKEVLHNAMQDIIRRGKSNDDMINHKLRSAGLIKGSTPHVEMANGLYEIYFRNRL